MSREVVTPARSSSLLPLLSGPGLTSVVIVGKDKPGHRKYPLRCQGMQVRWPGGDEGATAREELSSSGTSPPGSNLSDMPNKILGSIFTMLDPRQAPPLPPSQTDRGRSPLVGVTTTREAGFLRL